MTTAAQKAARLATLVGFRILYNDDLIPSLRALRLDLIAHVEDGAAEMQPVRDAFGDAVVSLNAAGDPFRKALADVEAIVVEQPPPPPPPPPTGLVEAFPNKINDFIAGGPSEMLDLSKMPPPVPWTTYTDDIMTVAKSMNGVEPAYRRVMHMLGHSGALYHGIQTVIEDADGKKTIRNLYPSAGDHPADQLAIVKVAHLRGGVRERHITTPYCTWHGHTRVRTDGALNPHLQVPMWVGITVDGRMCNAFRDGSVTYTVEVPLESYCYDFTYHGHESSVGRDFYLVDTGVGKVLRVGRRLPSRSEVFVTGFTRATSIRAVGNILYVCDPDKEGGGVWSVNIDDKAIKKVCAIPFAFWVDYDSNGQLLIAGLDKSLYRIDPATGKITATLLTPSAAPATRDMESWVTVSVDRNGTCGEKDAAVLIRSHGASNNHLYRFTSIGLRAIQHSFGIASVDNVRHVHDATGHYPWVAEHHPDDGLMMVQGFAEAQPSFIASMAPGDDAASRRYHYWHDVAERGQNLLRSSPPGIPSFSCQINAKGGSQLWSADAIGEMPYAEAVAFIKRGGIGSVPRPHLVGDDLRAVMYALYRNSQRFLREGAPLIDGLFAYLATLKD